jgi:hypothetical protein
MAEAMLQLHMKEGDQTKSKQNARAIAESLNTKYFHHGYPLNRKEAKEIGLDVDPADETTERLMWRIWQDIEDDLKLREPFLPIALFRADPNCKALFAPVPQLSLPPGAPPPVVQAFVATMAQQLATHVVPPTAFDYTIGIMESDRHASRGRMKGSVFAARQSDLDIKIQIVPESIGWQNVPIPTPGPPAAP